MYVVWLIDDKTLTTHKRKHFPRVTVMQTFITPQLNRTRS